MNKHSVLTKEEIADFSIEPEVLRYIEMNRLKLNLRKNEMNILDWGCGRGRSVTWLRKKGYNAFGVDIDPEPILNGKEFFQKNGLVHEKLLSLINQDGSINFPDDFFHFIFSEQVFEHISDLEIVASEMQRVTTTYGVGFHCYPGNRYIVEGHLFMPFVHWLPKNKIRKWLIFFFLLLGIDPKWQDLQGKNIFQKTQICFDYSVKKTYYRNYQDIKRLFWKKGFEVEFVTINHPKVGKVRIFCSLLKFWPFYSLLNYLLLTFKAVELHITKVNK